MSYSPDFTKKNNVGHLRAISNIRVYLSISSYVDNAYMWCDYCVQRRPRNHTCDGRGLACDGCGYEFHDQETLENHQSPSKEPMECPYCRVAVYNQDCLTIHACRQQDQTLCELCHRTTRDRPSTDHQCSEYKCRTCEEFVQPNHKCYIGRPKNLTEVDGDPKEYG